MNTNYDLVNTGSDVVLRENGEELFTWSVEEFNTLYPDTNLNDQDFVELVVNQFYD